MFSIFIISGMSDNGFANTNVGPVILNQTDRNIKSIRKVCYLEIADYLRAQNIYENGSK